MRRLTILLVPLLLLALILGAVGYSTREAQSESFNPMAYDTDASGGLSKAETLAAIVDYFAGGITKDQALAVVIIYFSGPTPTPSLVPTPTPTPSAVDFGSYSSYRSSLDYFHIVGEVLNNTETNIEFVKVIATYYDQLGQVIGTDFTYTKLDILIPGQRSPFDVNSSPYTLPLLDSYKIQVSYQTTLDAPFSGLTILSHTASIDAYGSHRIVGEIKNTSGMTAEFVEIVATYYDSSGVVIGTEFTYTTLDELAPGQVSSFEISSWPREIQPASYSLQAQGREK